MRLLRGFWQVIVCATAGFSCGSLQGIVDQDVPNGADIPNMMTAVDVPNGADIPNAPDVPMAADVPNAPPMDVPMMASCGNDFSGCNPVTNVPCAAGQGCYVTGPRAAACVMAGAGGPGTACATPDQCQAGLVCANMTCRKLCCAVEDAACRTGANSRPNAVCNISLVDGLRGCSTPDHCDLTSQTDCVGAENCYLIGANNATQCSRSTGNSMPNMRCAIGNDCPRGYLCSGNPGTEICRQFCDPTGTSMGMFSRCAMGFTCSHLGGQPANLGICNPI